MTTPDQPSRLTRYTRRVVRYLIGVLAVLGALAILGTPLRHTQPAPVEVGVTNPVDQCPNGWRSDGHTIRCLVAGEYAAQPGVDVPATPAEPSPAITEDDPRWDCATMGNRVCGPTQAERELVLTEDGTSVPAAFYDSADSGSGSVTGSVMAEDGTRVPASFYDRTDYTPAPKVAAPARKKKAGAVAEDGSRVAPGFYDETDYNRDGLVDQTGKPIGR